jgi:hypothetical protein
VNVLSAELRKNLAGWFMLRFSSCGVVVFCLLAAPSSPAQSLADLSQLATVVPRTSHRASSYDESGGNTDNVTGLAPGEVHTLLDAKGPGKVTHIWLTISPHHGHTTLHRDLVIRMFWEGSKAPSVEVPLGDFFGQGHGKEYKVASLPVNVGSNVRALNCYWPMPFYKHARIEIFNAGTRSARRIYYNIDYELGEIPPNQGLFHAKFHRIHELAPEPLDGNTHGEKNYVVLDTKGTGQYLGCFLFVDSAPGGWWGEGDEMIYINGEKKPSIVGTGTEDYFGNAWGFDGVANHPFYGVPFLEQQPDGWKQTTVYRLHVPDPVRFDKSIRVTLEHAWPGGKSYDYSSVAYWYQLESSARREPLIAREENQPRLHFDPKAKARAKEKPMSAVISGTEFEPALRAAGVDVRVLTTEKRDAFAGGLMEIVEADHWVELPLPQVAPGNYRVTVEARSKKGPIEARVGEGEPVRLKKGRGISQVAEAGVVQVTADNPGSLSLRSPATCQLEVVRLEPVK